MAANPYPFSSDKVLKQAGPIKWIEYITTHPQFERAVSRIVYENCDFQLPKNLRCSPDRNKP